ncbi:INTERACTORS OF CDC2 KINASE 7, KIP-RELATED PROTEIN 4, CYCLIN-DEPENDENT KINASE INHIBITOR 2 [Hibiscus trionum]|uniref:INTERACTORS OF CDC2 KINASE 7, KIP-RELATED PROTEIN 4, CYCLIN-DEPENDENT KINASE INHIBITOR 2 n=1 Tax=Hibiscus trionum TaxID=183268 RepID=A0A9W7MC82_HIBTR|nr:INTERACTORS OF CDC2 KINASE 7, KIP-RELATED PROTEIN 4, CYCLIN-DEPENDENT KINASE INHIBITOR 2 [Hibiscus trionum]
MGKYIRKAKTAGEVAVMEVSQASLGVRTRAKTLALKRLQKSSVSPPAAVSSAPAKGEGSYLQLRSRRLEKPPVVVHHHDSKRHKQQQQQQQTQQHGSKKDNCGENPNPDSNSRVRVGGGSDSEKKKEGEVGSRDIVLKDNAINYSNINNNNNGSNDLGDVEASFGENILDIEARERGTRESTPCSLIRDPESVRTPGSTTRPTCSAETSQRVQNSTRRHIPASNEMDEFFALAEVDQQRQFIEKYNFDPVKDKPLPGRYQWEKVDP